MDEDIVRVLRVYEFVGPRKWVEETVVKSIHGTRIVDFGNPAKRITGMTLTAYPEVLEVGRGIALPTQLEEAQHSINRLLARVRELEMAAAGVEA